MSAGPSSWAWGEAYCRRGSATGHTVRGELLHDTIWMGVRLSLHYELNHRATETGHRRQVKHKGTSKAGKAGQPPHPALPALPHSPPP